MNNFSDFIKNQNNQEKKSENKKYTKEELEDKINDYSKLSSDKLLEEFMRLTIEKKRKGELSDNELQNVKNTISPMLNTEQKAQLDKLLGIVKNVK